MSIGRTIISFAACMAALVALSTVAQARPDTRTYTCAGVQDFIDGRGAVTMSTGDRTFARFVASTRNCQIQQRARAAYVPTTDNPQCRVQTCGGNRSSDGRR
ncbi:MAG: hypothetical protein AAFW98_03905 [Pseudomonadota bacterium]